MDNENNNTWKDPLKGKFSKSKELNSDFSQKPNEYLESEFSKKGCSVLIYLDIIIAIAFILYMDIFIEPNNTWGIGIFTSEYKNYYYIIGIGLILFNIIYFIIIEKISDRLIQNRYDKKNNGNNFECIFNDNIKSKPIATTLRKVISSFITAIIAGIISSLFVLLIQKFILKW